ncbi:MAG: hypothetical protein EOP83_29905 [Verrucomicrobiaceae bacterium]|nr:MAG: hypothetical protein EOP83_29905 [Verrucomicrobiaceae bacterium]
MKIEQQRVHALDIAVRLSPGETDLHKLFAKADQITDYIGREAPKKVYFSTHQLAELMKASDDPLEFAKHCKIQHVMRGAIPFKPFPFQEDLINFIHGQPFAAVNMSRQMGASTIEAMYALWFAMMKPDQTILIAASRLNGALCIMDRIRFMYENLPDHLRVKTIQYQKGTIEFENGSRIFARAASNDAPRGLAINLIIIDDAAYISHSRADEFWTSLQPTISVTRERVIVASSAGYVGDMFYRIWMGAQQNINPATGCGANGFAGFLAPWSCHPERDEAWAGPFRSGLGEEKFAQEFECQFIQKV